MLWTYPCTVKECEQHLLNSIIYCKAHGAMKFNVIADNLQLYRLLRTMTLECASRDKESKNDQAIRPLEDLFCVRFASPRQGAIDARALGDEGMLLHVDMEDIEVDSLTFYPTAAEAARQRSPVALPEPYALVTSLYSLASTLREVQHVAEQTPQGVLQLLKLSYANTPLTRLPREGQVDSLTRSP